MSSETPDRDLAREKAVLRQTARAARRAIAPELRELAGRAVAERVVELLGELADGATVLAYCATPEELDPASTVAALRARGARIALPRVREDGALDLCETDEVCELRASSLGILEPTANAPLLSPEEVDVVLLPGVAFDASGRRLGLGGGFYDRLIPRLPERCLTVGIAFDEQLFTYVPHAEHDAMVDAVVTPTRVLRT